MRGLSIVLMVLVLMTIAIVGTTSPAPPVNKVVIGVLNFETGYVRPDIVGGTPEQWKKRLMRELRRNTQVKLVNVGESCSVSDLQKYEFEQAERYRNIYQLDMILHVYISKATDRGWGIYFSLLDLYRKKVKEVFIESYLESFHLVIRGTYKKVLPGQDLNRVLKAKKEALEGEKTAATREVKEISKEKVLGKKEVTVPREVKETPEEIEDLIQNGPKLISEGEYDRVLALIEDLPGKRRRSVQIQTLACFANLKGWVSDRDQSCKLSWASLRQKLINSGDNEATPMLVIFLRDEDPWMRIYAAELLGHIGDERALEDLREVGTNDENHKARRYAKKAYKQISGEKF